MSLHAKGVNHEKLKEFQQSINNFKAGKELVEATFGTSHSLFAVFSSAMGQAKLKTKYETVGEIRRKKSRSSSGSEKKKKKLPKLKPKQAIRSSSSFALKKSRKDKLMTLQAAKKEVDGSSIISKDKAHLHKAHTDRDNLFLTNFDT
jgi:hypothetical protein